MKNEYSIGRQGQGSMEVYSSFYSSRWHAVRILAKYMGGANPEEICLVRYIPGQSKVAIDRKAWEEARLLREQQA